MRRLSVLAALLLAGCGDKAAPPPGAPRPASREVLRAMNVAAYDAAKEKLQRESADKWTIIVRGQIGGPFASFEEATRRADELGPDDGHRFIWRPGEDDVPREFELSIWLDKPGEYGNWM